MTTRFWLPRAGRADLILTGDQHLVALGSFEEIEILPPAKVVRLLRDGGLGTP